MPDPNALTLLEAARLVRERALSPVELVDAALARIGRFDGAIKAWTLVDRAGARAAAAELEREARAGRLRGPLHGVTRHQGHLLYRGPGHRGRIEGHGGIYSRPRRRGRGPAEARRRDRAGQNRHHRVRTARSRRDA